jgi:hypothetical protein
VSWTYEGDLANKPRDLVRYLLGDVVEGKYSPADGDIDYWLSQNIKADGTPDVYKAASETARAMANKFATMVVAETRIGTLLVKYDFPTMAQQYYELADRLLAGRTSIAEGGPVWDDSQPSAFAIGGMDDPALGNFMFTNGGLGL